MSDDAYNQLLPAQSINMLPPRTIASASVIAPTTGLTIVTGTTQLVTITPPVSGWHVLYLQFPDAMGAFATSGNILVAADPGVDIPVAMHYNPNTAKYTPGPVS